MEKIRLLEQSSGFVPSQADYVKFWQNKPDRELNSDELFSITKYLGPLCSILNKDLRKKWLNIIGITLKYGIYKVLSMDIAKYVSDLELGSDKICRMFRDQSEVYKFCDEIVDKLPNLRILSFNLVSDIQIYAWELNEIETIPTKMSKMIEVMLTRLSLHEIRVYWIGGYGNYMSEHYLDTYVNDFFPNLSEEHRSKIVLINKSDGTVFNYCDVIGLYGYINKNRDKYILYKEIKLDLTQTIAGYGSSMGKTTLLISYHPNIIEYLNSVIVPLYKELGINLELVIFGQIILPPDYNPSIIDTTSSIIDMD